MATRSWQPGHGNQVIAERNARREAQNFKVVEGDLITAEIRINGHMIGHLNAVKEEETSSGVFRYRYGVYFVQSGEIRKGHVSHRRDDGFLPLLAEIAEDASSR